MSLLGKIGGKFGGTSGVVSKVQSNVQQRISTTKSTVNAEMATVRQATSELTSLKPVPAVLDLVVGTLDNVSSGVKKQAAIARSWVPI